MSPPTISVVPFVHSTFSEFLLGFAKNPILEAREKFILDFLGDYLTGNGAEKEGWARSIIVEPRYVDRDYIEDYSAYYARCFTRYRRFCARLHFFGEEVSQDELDEILENGSRAEDEIAKLVGSYLGFIVVKPLPYTFIGRTCLKLRPDLAESADFPVLRDYEVCLFGLELEIEKALAFQEQDEVTSACATSALWSAFHSTGKSFQHEMPSPVEITRRATRIIPAYNRALPSMGLTLEQMNAAVREVGLEPLTIDLEEKGERLPLNNAEDLLKLNVRAYISAGIPVIVVGRILTLPNEWRKKIADADESGYSALEDEWTLGRHATVVAGAESGDTEAGWGEDFPRLYSSHIQKLHVHDDQVGPYAPMELAELEGLPFHTASTLFPPANEDATMRFKYENVLLPLYHKIRIPALSILELIIDFNYVLNNLRDIQALDFPEDDRDDPSWEANGRFEWDVFLNTVHRFERDVGGNRELSRDQRRKLLTKSYPRFIWRVKADYLGATRFELLYDATGIVKSNYFLDMVAYDRDFCSGMIDSMADMGDHISAEFTSMDRYRRLWS